MPWVPEMAQWVRCCCTFVLFLLTPSSLHMALPGSWSPPDLVSLPPSVGSLPPSVGSEGHGSGSPGSGSEVDLPPDLDSEDGDEEKVAMPCEMKAHCNCCRNCLKKFDGDTIDSSRAEWQQQKEEDRRAGLWLEVVRQVQPGGKGTDIAKRVAWKFQGARVCQLFWSYVHYTSKVVLQEFKVLVQKGHATVPPYVPKMKRASPQLNKADAWFLGLYNSISEPMATEVDQEDDGRGECFEFEEVPDASRPLWSLTVGIKVGGQQVNYARKKYLNPGGFESLWALHTSEPPQNQVGKTTLYQAWNGPLRWCKYMPFRNKGQGGKVQRVC